MAIVRYNPFRDLRAMPAVELIFLSEMQRGRPDLFAAWRVGSDRERQHIPQDSILQTHSGNLDLLDMRLAGNHMQDDCGRNNDIGAVGFQIKFFDALIQRHFT